MQRLPAIPQVIREIEQTPVVCDIWAADYLSDPGVRDVVLVTEAILQQLSGECLALLGILHGAALLDESFGGNCAVLQQHGEFRPVIDRALVNRALEISHKSPVHHRISVERDQLRLRKL